MKYLVGVLMCCMCVSSVATGAIRYMDGVGFPTTETPGGESILGTLDWGTPSILSEVTYALDWGPESFEGTMNLLATNIAGQSAQLIYQDPANGLTMTAVSADGDFSLDAEDFEKARGYGGFEAWTLTDVQPELNRYGSITSIDSVRPPIPEPSSQALAVLGGVGLLVFRRWRINGRAECRNA